MTTMYAIAKIADVSIATVSRYLNSTGYVSIETGKRIESACVQLGYSYSVHKRKKEQSNKLNTIGVIISDFGNIFFADAIEEIGKIAHDHGKDVIICDSRQDSNIEMRYIDMLQSKVGGLIIAPVNQIALYNGAVLKDINDHKFPVVLLDGDFSNVHLDGIFTDGYRSAYEAVSTLIKLNHKNIVCVSGPTTCRPGLERLNGYMQALKDNGIPIREDFILYADFDTVKAYRLVKNLCDKNRDFTAVFSANIYMGLGVLKAFDVLDLKIPEDIAFLTFDDFPTFDFQKNNYSVIKNPGSDAGREAALLLMDRMNSGKNKRSAAVKRITLSADLLLRGSEQFPTKF